MGNHGPTMVVVELEGSGRQRVIRVLECSAPYSLKIATRQTPYSGVGSSRARMTISPVSGQILVESVDNVLVKSCDSFQTGYNAN